MVRVLFRPQTRVSRMMCLSASPAVSTIIFPELALLRNNSPSFGSRQLCSYSKPLSRSLSVAHLHIRAFTFIALEGVTTENLHKFITHTDTETPNGRRTSEAREDKHTDTNTQEQHQKQKMEHLHKKQSKVREPRWLTVETAQKKEREGRGEGGRRVRRVRRVRRGGGGEEEGRGGV